MKARLRFFFAYALFWFVLFILGKLVFLLYQHNQSFLLSIADWFKIISHGLKLDFSALGYLVAFPVLVLAVTSFWKGQVAAYILNAYTAVVLILFIMISLVDHVIYRAWSVHLDYTPLRYLANPKEVLANLAWYHFVLLLFVTSLIFWGLFSFYRKHILSLVKNANSAGWMSALTFMIIFFSLFFPVRGGIGTTPINISSAYHSQNIFANQAAINVLWYFGHSVVEGKETRNPYTFFKAEGYEKDLEELYKSDTEPVKVINTERPTIILIMMETFTAKLVEPLGGAPGVTPNFSRLCKEGILFSHLYANGTRTDRGMVSIVSGFPTVEPITVLKYPEKTHKMAFLSRDLAKLGYSSTFYYGGDVDFANMKSYLINGGFNKLYSEKDFSYYTGFRSNWGVPDHVVFDKVIEEVSQQQGPALHLMLTLSNHEPFDIPGKPHFEGMGFKNKFYSSAYFADSCLGDFINKLKRTDRWDSCLVIFVADHGSPLPDFSQYHEPAKYKIPMLWIGGALKKDSIVAKYCAQSDIAITLLHQLGIHSDQYVLGKDILSPSSGSFTFYSFMDGMAMMSDTLSFGLDFISGNLLFSNGQVPDEYIRYVKALQQFVYNYYLSL